MFRIFPICGLSEVAEQQNKGEIVQNHILQISIGKDFVDVDMFSTNSVGGAQLTFSKGYHSQKWDHAWACHNDTFHKWTQRDSVPMEHASILVALFHLLAL